MKVGIMTFSDSYNYGAVLQAYALEQAILKLGHQPEIIRVRRDIYAKGRDGKDEEVRETLLVRAALKFQAWRYGRCDLIRKNRFEAFRKQHLIYGAREYSTPEALLDDPPVYDAYLCGSDQIWNPFHKVFSFRYMLDFVPKGKRKIAYAPSFGVSDISSAPEYREIIKLAGQFDYLSVRECSGALLLKAAGILNIHKAFDPVFLLESNEWEKLTSRQRPYRARYVLLYSLVGVPGEINSYIQQYAREKGYQIVVIPYSRSNVQNAYWKSFDSGMPEFLTLIRHAECVFTNSFHGCAFSIIFERPLRAFIGTGEEAQKKAGRIVEMLEEFGMANCLLKADMDQLEKQVTPSEVRYNACIQQKIVSSKQFLYNSLNI